MGDKKKLDFDRDLGKALRSYGYDFPETKDEIEVFEQKLSADEVPIHIEDNPTDILRRGLIKKVDLPTKLKVDHRTTTNLAMAAREGKELSEAVRRKMEEDRKRADEDKTDRD